MERVIAYIDGFNLYYGLREKFGRRYLWLDLPGLAASLLGGGQELRLTRYCTARISTPKDSVRRQATFIDALEARGGVVVHEGKFQPKTMQCRRCGRPWQTHEEKQTDVNLAVEMLKDAHHDRFDMALLVSGDSDLAPAVRAVRELHPTKRVVIAFPPARYSDVLMATANGSFTIGRGKIAKAQLPKTVATATGYVLRRPREWA